MKLPPYGKALAERLKFANTPQYVVVTIGLGAWDRAKRWNESPADTVALVLSAGTRPESLSWPVKHLPVVIDADVGPPLDLINTLALRLLTCGAVAVTLISITDEYPFTQYCWSNA